jgi:hypothetical protein
MPYNKPLPKIRFLCPLFGGGVALLLAGCPSAPAENPPSSPSETVTPSPETAPVPAVSLVNRTKEAGLRYRWRITAQRPLTIGEVMGNGCAFLDYDNDGKLDILLVGSPPALFRGDGKGKFTDVSKTMGIATLRGKFLGCAVGDYDNDGWSDLYLSGYKTGVLLRNRAGKGFTNVTASVGLPVQPFGASALFHDIDSDGRLDLLVCNYVVFDAKTQPQLCRRGPRSIPTSCPPTEYKGLTATLFLNTPQGFRDKTRAFGLDKQAGAALGVTVARCGADDEPCLYIANDEREGNLFIPDGKNRFQNIGRESGTAGDNRGRVHAGMGVDWGDFDNDGRDDLFVTTFSGEIKNLYRNNGDFTFTDVAEATGLQERVAPYVSFGAKWADFDNDGFLDILLTSGHVRDNVAEVTAGSETEETYRQPTQLLMNQEAKRFVEVPLNLPPIVGRGLAIGDYDNDGRIDALVVDSEGEPILLHNETSTTQNYLLIDLRNERNQPALGAVVTAILPDGRRLRRLCQAGGSYLSSSDPVVHLGLGEALGVTALIVQWQDGRYQEYPGVRANQKIALRKKK